MAVTEGEILARIATARALGSEAFPEAFENTVLPLVADFGRDAVTHVTEQSTEGWLRVFAALPDLSLEGPPETTARLWDEHRAVFLDALGRLSPSEQAEVKRFTAALDAPDLDIAAFETDASEPALAADTGPVLARFVVTDSFDGARRRVWAGKLAVFGRDGRRLAEYAARTGGFVADFRLPNGPTPPGTYRVGNYRSNRTGAPGMTRDGVSFSFDLKEVDGTAVFGRSALRIHPDQAPPGTHGCIGIAEDGDGLRSCAKMLAENLASDHARLVVSYGSQGDLS